MAYDPNRPHSYINKRPRLATVATGILLAGLGATELYVASAQAVDHGTKLEQADLETTKESPLKPLDNKLESLLTEMRTLVRHHQKGVYVQEFKLKGKKETRITASEKLHDPQTGQISYNHFSMMAGPGAKLPEACSLLNGVNHPEFQPGESFRNSAFVSRANNPMEQYYFELFGRDPNGGLALEYHFLLTDRHPDAKDFSQKLGLLNAFVGEGKRITDKTKLPTQQHTA
jgi:hypothetical protein